MKLKLKLFIYKTGVVFLFVLTLLPSCKKDEVMQAINLPPTPILSMREKWGAITSSHLRLRSSPDSNSDVVTTFWNRRDVVLEVLSQSSEKVDVEGREGYWYQVSYDGLVGWVFGGYVELFGTKEQALRSARESR